MPAFDLVALANACYTLANEERAWLLGIVNVLQPWLDRGLGIAAWSFRVGDWECLDPPPTGVDPALGNAIRAVGRGASPELKSRFFLGPRAQPGCERIGNTTGLDRDLAFKPLWPFRIRDFHSLTLLDNTGLGLAFLAPEFHVITSNAAMTRRLERAGTQILAAFRLRHALGQLDAVLTSGGRLVHAVGEAREPAQRVALQRAVKALDRTWSKRRLQDWDAAFDTWQGLVAGRWSLVQSFESDGRRYLVARRNPPAAGISGSALQPLTSHALRLRAQGVSYKCIADELGTSITCAHRLVKGACRRLGIRSDSELPQLLRAVVSADGAAATRGVQL